MRFSLPCLALLCSLAASASAQDLDALYKAKKWSQVIEQADKLGPSPENDFIAARALRNLGREDAARERYQRVLRAQPDHADAAIEAALMLVKPLEQVAHTDADRALAARAAKELEAVAAWKGLSAASLARASYTAGNTWSIAERDGLAFAAYERVLASGDKKYFAKTLHKQGELAYRSLDVEAARGYWTRCIAEGGRSSAVRAAQRGLARLAMAGKPAPKFDLELWAKGPPSPPGSWKGQVTLIYAFAVWCPHCKREIPHVAELLERYSDQGFHVVGLTANKKTQTTGDVFPFIEDPEYRISYPVAIDQGESTTTTYHLTGLPSAALVDRSGNLRWVGHPNYLTEATIQALLGEPATKS